MKKLFYENKFIALKTFLSVLTGFLCVSCEKDAMEWYANGKNKPDKIETLDYEPGQIPGLGNTAGEITGKPFSFPAGVELNGEITGGGKYGDYWRQTSGEQATGYRGSGKGYVCLLLKLRNTKSSTVQITIPAATVYNSIRKNCQNGVLLKKVVFEIPANGETTICLSLYCGNKSMSRAGNGHIFDTGVTSNAKPLLDFCERLKNKKINIEDFSNSVGADVSVYSALADNLQNILWKITDGGGLAESDIEYINSLPNN